MKMITRKARLWFECSTNRAHFYGALFYAALVTAFVASM